MEGIGLGILIGVGLALLGKRAGRPVVKSSIKAGIIASERAMDALHEGKEALSDLVAEARHEATLERSAAEQAAASPKPDEPGGQTSN